MRRNLTAALLSGALLLGAMGTSHAVYDETTIYAIQQDMIAIGDSVLVDSVVVIGVDIRPGTYGVYIQEPNSGPYSGILAYRNTIFPAYENSGLAVTVGDLITVVGRYADFAGLAEIDVPLLTRLGTVTPLAPTVLTVDDLKTVNPNSEQWEGVLVRVNDVKVTSIEAPFNNWRFHMNSGPPAGQVDSLVAYEKMISGQVVPQVGDILASVTGVLDWAFNDRRIAPRGDNDIVFTSPAPAPVPNLAYSTAENKIKVRFNVNLQTASAQTTTNYSLSTLQPITSAVYDNATKTVTLTTGSNLVPSTTPHTLSMSGIRNSQNVIMSGTQAISFIGGIAPITFVQTPKSASNDTSQVANQQVSMRGVVTETTGVDYPASIGGFYLQQRGAVEYAGIFIFGAAITPVRGDSVFVSGIVTEFGVGPETEITSIDEVTVLASNRPPIQPITVTIPNVSGPITPNNDSVAEKYESMLVRVAGAVVLGDDIPNNPGSYPGQPFDVSTSLAGTDTLRVDDLAIEESGYSAVRGNSITITGIIRFSGTAPFRRLQPRNWSEPGNGGDILHTGGVTDVLPTPQYTTRLLQNTPNPFNPTTNIDFTLEAKGMVRVEVFDVTGRLVARLLDAEANAGPNRVTWNGLDTNGKQVQSGIYFYRLLTPIAEQTRKMVMVK